MTTSEIDWLLQPNVQALIEQHLNDDPMTLALKGVDPVVCSQVKYLQRSGKKLPSYYQKQCIIPPLSYEQSSSEAVAATKTYTGDHCVDLTAGLCVDVSMFSRRFRQVTAIERDDLLCRIARHNLSLLGCDNVTVINDDATNFIASYNGPCLDLVYVDPARRDVSNKKVALFEDCSPNIIDLMPTLCQKTRKVVVKASPLFDVKECFRLFCSYGDVDVAAISLDGECKEVLITITCNGGDKQTLSNVIVSSQEATCRYQYPLQTTLLRCGVSDKEINDYSYVAIPDVVFYKTRTVRELVYTHYPECLLDEERSPVLCNQIPLSFPGKVYQIIEMMEYKPKLLHKYFSIKGINRVTLLRHYFPFAIEQVRKVLKLKEGDQAMVLCCTIRRKNYLLLVAPIQL